MDRILVTGGNGQLGQSIKREFSVVDNIQLTYVDFEELDITDRQKVLSFFEGSNYAYCINCAAYTAVDLAEKEQEKADKVNNDAAKFLVEACKKYDTKLIHISTDFVFDGHQSTPYNEGNVARPLNTYGLTKLAGEEAIQQLAKDYVIIRTSWLYSEYGTNFVKTMMRLGQEKSHLNVICDQFGTPTYASDLARIIKNIILAKEFTSGLYHFSNEGVASWYDFAFAIMNYAGSACKVLPIKAVEYPTTAVRPSFSVMDKTKIKQELDVEIPHWTVSLRKCIENLIDNRNG
jgi:dTDP-4-dehydrorhamnose reductase